MNPLTTQQYVSRLAGCLVGLMVLIILSPGIGSTSSTYGWWDVWRAKLGWEIPAAELINRPLADLNHDGIISEREHAGYVAAAKRIFSQRFPRTLLALQVGATLALCGATFQILFRNPLATPYTLGIAGGGSLGALIAIRFGWSVVIVGISSLTLSSFAGALAIVAAVFVLARGAKRLTSNELLLAGVTMGMFCSAMMMLITVLSDQRQTFTMVRWMMGSLDTITTIEGATLLPLLLPAWIFLILNARSLNQYRMGEELAQTRGVSVIRLQMICVLVCTLAIAGVVAQCGPIGFVGLVVPHIVILLMGSDCRLLLPASALMGGGFLILCDWASQLAMRLAGSIAGESWGSVTLPIGVVTAVIGVPLFLTLLWTRKR